MDGLCGVTLCVDYDDMLALTLRRNMRHLQRCVVVTSHEDDRTAQVVRGVAGVELFRTDAFTRDGASFNRGLAIEEGLTILDHSGWTLSLDADIVLPKRFEPWVLDPDVIYGTVRRQLPEGVMDLDGDWTCWELVPGPWCIGYFQLFHMRAKGLRERPWYPTTSGHAGKSDGEFAAKFKAQELLPCSVLHIGRPMQDWCGRVSQRLDGVVVPLADQKRQQMNALLEKPDWYKRRPSGKGKGSWNTKGS